MHRETCTMDWQHAHTHTHIHIHWYDESKEASKQ